jgi:predicted transcriptional regulator
MATPAPQNSVAESSAESALAEVRRKIAKGLEQAEQGELFDGEEVFRETLEKL